MSASKTVLLGSTSGLCNRIRMLSNWLARASAIRMLWPVTSACPAYWDDMFHPLDRVKFERCSAAQAIKHRKPINEKRSITLLDLKPRQTIEKICGPYTAVHVRRTDLVALQLHRKQEVRDDAYFFEEIEKTGVERIYLATDNAKTQSAFLRQYGDRLIVHEPVNGYGSRHRPVRCTPMSHAIADLYACVEADHFIGTNYSSFSGEIKRARQSRTTERTHGD